MRYRKTKSVSLARSLNVSEAVISLLVNSHHGLSAKWLRRIAPLLDITPGMLLDYDPASLDDDVIEILLATYSAKGAGYLSLLDPIQNAPKGASERDMPASPFDGLRSKQ